MTASTMQIGLEVAVRGTPQAVSDLGLVDAALKGVGSASASAGAAGRQGADTAKAAWNEYKAAAAGAKASVEGFALSLEKVRTASQKSNLTTQRAEIDRLARSCGLSATSIEGMIRRMEQVRKARAFAELREEARLSTLQLARLQAGMGDLSGAFGTVARGVAAAKFAIAGFAAAALYAAMQSFDAALRVDRLEKSYATITGSAQNAGAQLTYLYEVSDRLGLQFQSTAEAAKGFFAAGKGTSLEKDLKKIFEGVSEAAAALSLSRDDVKGVFLALGQMISKGAVQAEELRGQLGERLPGAFQMAARAMGVTTAELSKMLELGQVTAEDMLPALARELHKTYGEAAVQAAEGAQGAVNRLSSEWERFKADVSQTDVMVAGINAVTGALKGLNAAMKRRKLNEELREAGVEPEGKASYRIVGKQRIPVPGQYSDTQRKLQETYGTADQAAILTSLRERDLKDARKEQAARQDRAVAEAVKSYADAVKNSLTAKTERINAEFDRAIKAQLAAKAADPNNGAGYDQRVAALEAERQRQLDGLNKGSEAAGRYAESFRAAVTRMRQANDAFEANLVTSSDNLERAAEKAKQSYEVALAAIAGKLEEARKKGVSEADREAYRAQAARKAELAFAQEQKRIGDERAEREARNAQTRLDFEKRYADMLGLTSDAVKKSVRAQYEEYRKAGVDIVRLEEWKRDQIQRASKEAFDGAAVALRDYAAAAKDEAKAVNAAFSGLFNGLDRGFETMWEGVIERGRVSLDAMKSLFSSFLVQMLNMAITRPIVVRLAGAVSGVLGLGGTAAAAGGGADAAGGTGGTGFGSLFGNIPFSSLLPDSWTSGLGGLFDHAAGGINGAFSGLTGGFFASDATTAQFNALANSITGGWGAGGATFLGALGAAGAGFGLGSLAGNLLFPDRPTIGQGAGIGGGLGAAIGAVVPGIGTVLGGVLGGIFGGGIGGLFGKKKKKPAVWTGVGVDLASGSYSVDSVGRNGVGGDTESAIEAAFGQAIQGALDTARALTEALPEKYSKELQSKLGGFSTSYEWKGGDIDEAHIREAAQNLQDRVYESLLASFRQVDFSESGLNVDTSSIAGMQKAISAFQAWDEMEKTMNAVLEPVPVLTQTVTGANEQMDAWIKNLKELGWTEEKLAEIEAKRQDYIDGLTFTLRKQFDMEMELREASLKGTQGLVQAQQALWADMQSIAANFGIDSDQARRWETYQKDSIPKLAEELAKGQYQSELAALQQQARAFRAVARQLTGLRAGMRVSEQTSPFDVVGRADEAGADYRRALTAAMGGDLAAAQQLSGLSTTYLSEARAGAASGADYSDVFYGVMADLAAVEKLFGSQLSDADLGLEEQKQSNKTLAEILAEIERLNKAIKDATESNTKTLLDYLAGLMDGTITTRAAGGCTPAGWTLVGERGPELVRFDEPGMVYTAEQTAAVFRAAGAPREIRTGGGSGDAALRLEITALRRDMARLFDRIERNTRRASDALEKWDDDGLPAPRSHAAAPIRRAR